MLFASAAPASVTASVPAADRRLRPLAELPADRLAGLVGVLTDIDDTLTRHSAIEPSALAALHALAAAGLPVVAITGRPAGWSRQVARDWPLNVMVAENGGVMLRRGDDGAWRCSFTVDKATRLARSARLAACARAILAEVPGATLARDSAGRLTDIAVDHSETSHLDQAGIDRVVAVMRRHGLTATVSSIHVNGWIGEHSKWSAAGWAVREGLGLDFAPADWVYLGDSTNDQLMFEHLPLSVAVANIDRFVPQLTVLPGYVTRAERGAGFAELAQALLDARRAAGPR